jgi:CxxC motif-containing protein
MFDVLLFGENPLNDTIEGRMSELFIELFVNNGSTLSLFPLGDNNVIKRDKKIEKEYNLLDNNADNIRKFIENKSENKVIIICGNILHQVMVYNTFYIEKDGKKEKMKEIKDIKKISVINFGNDNERLQLLMGINENCDGIVVLNEYWMNRYKKYFTKPMRVFKYTLDEIKRVDTKDVIRKDLNIATTDYIIGNLNVNNHVAQLDVTIRVFFRFLDKMKERKESIEKFKLLLMSNKNPLSMYDIDDIKQHETESSEYRDKVLICGDTLTIDTNQRLRLYNMIDLYMNTNNTIKTDELEEMMCMLNKPMLLPNITIIETNRILKQMPTYNKSMYNYECTGTGGIAYIYNETEILDKLLEVYDSNNNNNTKYVNLGNELKRTQNDNKTNELYVLQTALEVVLEFTNRIEKTEIYIPPPAQNIKEVNLTKLKEELDVVVNKKMPKIMEVEDEEPTEKEMLMELMKELKQMKKGIKELKAK